MLIPCKDCEKKISHKAFSCPHCGFKLSLKLREMSDFEVKWMMLKGNPNSELIDVVEPDPKKQAILKKRIEEENIMKEQRKKELNAQEKKEFEKEKNRKNRELRQLKGGAIGVAIVAPIGFLLYQLKILDFGHWNWLFMFVLVVIIGNYFENKFLRK
jgi:hypothetical protein